MVYRPTVRYHSTFKKYVDDLFYATHLDRNQIIRAALFAAAHSKEFHSILRSSKKKDVPLPHPKWSLDQAGLWREQNPDIKEKGEDVNACNRRKTSGEESGREREIFARTRKAGGGLTIQLRP
ncbi:hypothetical protein ACH0BF_20525 [Pseudobacillus sp. 179-B 2D1 NHS]|uniref:hypothetical protein n=1 Tax=Pseudobacillus sp. 179-B 2D1 NHS TaxID=3374292 RepID=UPI0038794C10